MTEKLERYKEAELPLPLTMRLWPLYGAGFENLGQDGEPIEVPLPEFGADELLVRHDAVGLCFSDVKVIRAGDHHPRLQGRDMQENPVTLGHEVSLTVVAVGDNLKDRFEVGERFLIQADIYVDGRTMAYGYVLQGGLSEYNVLGEPVLNGDDGCYLLPIHEDMAYATVALTEPWACVERAYHIDYRTIWQDGGVVWIIGTSNAAGRNYTLGQPWAEGEHPSQLLLTDVPDDLAETLKQQAADWSIPVDEIEMNDEAVEAAQAKAGETGLTDIIVLGMDADIIEAALASLPRDGALNIVAQAPMSRPIEVDVGRIHYDGLMIYGTTETDISAAYKPVRTEIKEGGKAWFLGAAGPMGQMLVQYALEQRGKPALVMPHDLVGWRLADLVEKLGPVAKRNDVEMFALNAEDKSLDQVHAILGGRAPEGFDDIVVPAPSARAVEMTIPHIGENGVICIFAGLPRGTMANLDLSAVYQKGVRFTGSSGSGIDDMERTLLKAEGGELFPQQVVAAVASLEGAAEGLRAVADASYSGKVVIYPHIKPLPVTPLNALKDRLPKVAAKLGEGNTWTQEAEDELLREMLP